MEANIYCFILKHSCIGWTDRAPFVINPLKNRTPIKNRPGKLSVVNFYICRSDRNSFSLEGKPVESDGGVQFWNDGRIWKWNLRMF